MKILSNFDTNYRRDVLADYVDQYGSDNVLLIQRSSLFAWLYVYVPLIIYSIIIWLAFYITYFLVDVDLIIRIVWLIAIFFIIFMLVKTIQNYIDYILDFGIITPKWVSLYTQTWILNRDATSLNLRNIRTITVSKKWFIYSFFNNGDIIILSEWTENQLWEVKMQYVYKPEEKRERIRHIFATINPRNY